MQEERRKEETEFDSFLINKTMESSSEDSQSESSTLLNKLKQKFKLKHGEPKKKSKLKHDEPSKKKGKKEPSVSQKSTFARPGNKSARKETRKIQIGLKVNGKHIRLESTGGGRRIARMDKSDGKNEIIAKGKEFFFSQGSRFGLAENYDLHLVNFELLPILETQTIGQMYESTGVPLLRFYLCANDKKSNYDASCVTLSSDSSSETENTETLTSSHDIPSTSTSTSRQVSGVDRSDLTEDDDLYFLDMGTPTVQRRINIPPRESTSDSLSCLHDIHNFVDDDGTPLQAQASGGMNVSEEVQASGGINVLEEVRHETKPEKIKVHRGNTLQELITHFKDKENEEVMAPVTIQMIMPNGKEEDGEDTGGVLRDTLSEFWESFYEMNTSGGDVKVPCVRDSMSRSEWRACGHILVMGYRQEGYFPHQLAKPFLHYTMDGNDNYIHKDHPSLIPTFLNYVPASERDLLTAALQNFDSVENDDLMDVLDSYGVKRLVTSTNYEDVLRDTAHRTLIQGPAYISRCWHDIFVNKLKPIMKGSIDDICDAAVPSTKKVLSSITFPDNQSEAERNTGKHLTKYIRSLSNEKLVSFMRYTTGAHLMLGRKITVRYVEQSEFSRRPIAHTCGCVLELSPTHSDYIEFRSEFNSVLDAKVWVMDIV